MLSAVSDHALLEARAGAYVAQEMAADALAASRAAIGRLLGMPEGGIAFVESASVALSTLLQAWPFEQGATVAVAPSEWGPNLATFTRHGLGMVDLRVDADGHVDLAELEDLLASSPPSMVHITQVASHRPLVQPATEIATVCRQAGVPLIVDAAQALGHVDTATGADIIYATSRKWLTGPRGVGVLAAAPQCSDRLRATLTASHQDPADETIGAALSSREAHLAGRLGLGRAAQDLLEMGPAAVFERLAAVGRATRRILGSLDNWRVIGPTDEASAITALEPAAGQDVMGVRSRLLRDHGTVTTAQQVFRAPRDMSSLTLRVSPHVDCTSDDLVRLREALASL